MKITFYIGKLKKTIVLIILAFLVLLIFTAVKIYDKNKYNSIDLLSYKPIDEKNYISLNRSRDSIILKRENTDKKVIWKKKFKINFRYTSSKYEHYYKTYQIKAGFTNDIVMIPIEQSVKGIIKERTYYAIDYENGKVLWKTNLPTSISRYYFHYAFDEKSVYVYTLSLDNIAQLHKLNKSDGKLLWSKNISLKNPVVPVNSNKYLILHSYDLDKIIFVDKNTGETILEEKSNSYGILYNNSLVYLKEEQSKNYSFYTIDLDTLEIKNMFTLSESISTINENTVIFSLYKDNLIYNNVKSNTIKAVSVENGTRIWELKYPSEYEYGYSNISINNMPYGLNNFNPEYELFSYPMTHMYYNIQTKYYPVILRKKITKDEKYLLYFKKIILDLDNGKIKIESDDEILSDIKVYYSDKNYYLIEHDDYYVISKINGLTGEIKDNIFNYDKSNLDFQIRNGKVFFADYYEDEVNWSSKSK